MLWAQQDLCDGCVNKKDLNGTGRTGEGVFWIYSVFE